jgi:octaprenyl-diphosphate synthase
MLLEARKPGILTARLKSDLADVEARFRGELASDLGCVNALVEHIEHYRGKMLRPMLVLVSEAAIVGAEGSGEAASERHRTLATVVEMVHMATLVHDDILDDARMRRRGVTINHLSGNEAAVMLGDYLISHAYHLCSALEDQAIARAVARTTNTVCEGELLQLANRTNWELDERTYFEIIRRKTASLCGLCCRLSAELAGGTSAAAEALGTYGENVGIAFQIVDDLLDLAGDQDLVGKTLGRDLEKGKLTLPVIRTLASARGGERRELVNALDAQGDPQTPEGVRLERMAWVRDRVLEGDGLAYAREKASALVDGAKAAVEAELPPSEARSLMLDMAGAVLTRSH